jgi:ABC-type dipeptide/oligopeptide/nickel transport system permease component
MTEIQETSPANKNKTTVIIFAIIALVILAGLIFGIIVLSKQNTETTGKVRDIFIIVLALESLLLGVALVVLVVQLAVLTNLIQNEVKPILASTKEAVSTIKGTSRFISDRAVKPIITASSFMAGSRKLFEIIGFIKRKE